MATIFTKLFDPVKKISYRRLLAWSVGTALCYTGKIGDEAWMWVTIAFIAGEAAKTLRPPSNTSDESNGKN
tara:strand:+ start:407 stop:619 length:213 start_codon:yes stop_codon:yes gene_type:complete